jgi:hypothetical protein
MIDAHNFVRGHPRTTRLESNMGPGALRRNGALFRCSRNVWNAADDISAKERLAFASPRRKCSSAMLRTPFRSGMWSGEGASTPAAPGSFLLVRRSHGYPVFLPRFRIGRPCVVFTLPVHDDAMIMCPASRGCQITNRALPDPRCWKTSPVHWPLLPPQSPSC